MKVRATLACLLLAGAAMAVELRPETLPGTGITLHLPSAWQTVLPAQGTTIRRRQVNGTAGVAISITRTTLGPAAFAQESLAELQRLAFEFELLDWDFTRQIRGRTWSRLHFRFVLGETRWEEQLWLTVDNGQAVAAAFSARPAEWAAWAPVFEAALVGDGGSRPVLTR